LKKNTPGLLDFNRPGSFNYYRRIFMDIQSNAAATADGMYISKSKVENAIDHFSRFSGLAVG